MKKSVWLAAFTTLALTACDTIDMGTSTPQSEFISELPEGVLAIAAPFQNLAAVKIDPIDGCYVYRHNGPVETTFLPLRATSGRPICTRAPDAPAPS